MKAIMKYFSVDITTQYKVSPTFRSVEEIPVCDHEGCGAVNFAIQRLNLIQRLVRNVIWITNLTPGGE